MSGVKYEYKMFANTEWDINEAAKEGWELVCTAANSARVCG